jgi:hypothetical protein
MNVRLLRKIIKVLSEPKFRGQFDMNYWHGDKTEIDGAVSKNSLCEIPKEKQIKCTTTHCIAGWAQVLDPKRDCYRQAEIDARRLLRLNKDEANRLFYADAWPKGFGGWNATRKQAAARIELFIKSKGAV